MTRNDPPADPVPPQGSTLSSRVLSFRCEDDAIVIYDRQNSAEWIKSSHAVELRHRR
jgi:hypothetical protein